MTMWMYRLAMLRCVVLALVLIATASADDRFGIDYLKQDQVADRDLTLTRLNDQATIALNAGDKIDVAPGAYREGKGDRIVCIRADDSPEAFAESLIGLPARAVMNHDLQSAQAQVGVFDQFSLVVHCWRLADQWDWPWVDHGDYWGGLGGLCRRITVGYAEYEYDAKQGCYVTGKGAPIAIIPAAAEHVPDMMSVGDLVAVEGRVGMLVRDAGTVGALDPADDVVTAAIVPDQAEAVRIEKIGNLFGKAGVNCFSRDRDAAQRLMRLRANGDEHGLGKLSSGRKWLLFVGMAMLVGVMLRHHRKKMRELKNR